jgi:plastocyanin domain-containing protein
VIFPALGKSIEIPLFDGVALELSLSEPGRYEFTCEHGVLHGVLEVEGEAGGESRIASVLRRSEIDRSIDRTKGQRCT